MEEPSSVKCEGRSQHSSRVLSDTPGSSLSLVRDESQGKKVADIKPFQSLALSLMATGTPALLTSPLTFPSHAADTFLFPPPSFCLPYHVPPSPLARQIMYQLPSHSLESSPALQADGAKQITFLIWLKIKAGKSRPTSVSRIEFLSSQYNSEVILRLTHLVVPDFYHKLGRAGELSSRMVAPRRVPMWVMMCAMAPRSRQWQT